ncbi:MAG: hypothetical protein A3J93_04430 [Candidatus Magasanikbacteria bacterium RIFOXYC2_FULL_42_28]|uniref:Glycosyltransferase subfamily 4-like N-terminal domain-containing protein n=1 Tax=Candidatus Magasanikbacteria bacterium RIFOXYC2_FULL_42_28 TaxID=1798704 RepID=A0A1F6NX16_9BACT|nr:MAG: hypothetical protein A3J93_04430 [Candidatus Magasanikbacteria bacterium RIFOXYC2_FULL_42_28]
MKLTHIIPSAFEYFDDIRDRAFSWVEALNNLGVEVDVFTLQYGGKPPITVREEVATVAPSRNYEKTASVQAMTKIMATKITRKEPEIIHLHTPFLGGGGEIFKFIKSRPNAHLVVTHHRPVKFVDLISVYIYFYNRYYLPEFFTLADAILLIEPKAATREQTTKFGSKVYMLGLDKTTNPDYPHPLSPETVAENLIIMYNELVGD